MVGSSIPALGVDEIPPKKRHAPTKPKSANAFSRLISCCVPLPARRPIQLRAVNTRSTPIEYQVAFEAPSLESSVAEYSPKMTHIYDRLSVLSSQSAQPTTNPP